MGHWRHGGSNGISLWVSDSDMGSFRYRCAYHRLDLGVHRQGFYQRDEEEIVQTYMILVPSSDIRGGTYGL
jgi:hypothetical protein